MADVHNSIDPAIIDGWQAIHKEVLYREKHETGTLDVGHYHDIIENSKHDFSNGILAPTAEDIDNIIDNPTNATKILPINYVNADAQTIADKIHLELSLNDLQRLVVEQVLDHVIQTKYWFCASRENRIILYV